MDSNKPLTKEDVGFYLSGKVPKPHIRGQEVGVAFMTAHYITDSNMPGTNVITFVYITKDDPGNKILSISPNNERMFNQ